MIQWLWGRLVAVLHLFSIANQICMLRVYTWLLEGEIENHYKHKEKKNDAFLVEWSCLKKILRVKPVFAFFFQLFRILIYFNKETGKIIDIF